MTGTMSHPGLSMSPHPPHMAPGGSAPGFGSGPGLIGRTHSPAPNHFGPNGHHPTLSGQNTGSQGFGQVGASPLAGSLSAGADIMPRPGSSSSNRLGVSPHSSNLALPRAPSPAHPPRSNSRPNSGQSDRSVSPGAGVRPQLSQGPSTTVPYPQQGSVNGQQGLAPLEHAHTARLNNDLGHTPHLEGLAHRSNHLGPPDTLHDRVVFVSNLPLTMQWQELKDLLRPAGLIIRADVASSSDGRPRGFGTALFGAVQDAARAVHLFNGRELGGRRIRVYLERDSHHHDARRSSHSQTDLSVTGSESANGHNSESGDLPTSTTEVSTPAQAKPSLASRVPWHLNLTNSTPPRSTPNGTDATPHFGGGFPNTRNGEATPHFRNVPHPSHIAMPPWPSLDSPDPLSPIQTRGLPPMTPSMPGFVFNNAYPDTPPVPHHFMGPFSPGLPVTSPTGFAYNPFLNAAPGAPVNRAPTGGSAQLGTPTTQAFPHNSIRGVGPPGAPSTSTNGEDYFPSTDSSTPTYITPPSLGARTTSQSVLNARDRLAPSAPDAAVADVNSLAASMALHSLITGQETPPSPTSANRRPKPSSSGADLGAIGERSNGVSPVIDMGRTGRFSLDDNRPNLDIEVGSERRASFGDSRK